MTETVNVTEADRDAVVVYWMGWSNNVPEHNGEIHPLVYAFARHRIEAARQANDRIAQLEAEVARLTAENFTLAAGQCIVENGLLCGEHGHLYCALQETADGE